MNQNRIDRKRLYSLLKNLVDIYSPSGKEEEITEWLSGYLTSLAGNFFEIRREPVDSFRENIMLCKKGTNPDFLFLGHIDTVPAFDIENYGFAEKNDLCSGLGTADMKGGCAAMVEAFIAAAESDSFPDNAMLALVAGEEESGDGTKAFLERHDFRHAIIAEPTSLVPCLEHYSYVEMVLRVYGYRKHAAVADRESGAIRNMLKFLLELENRIDSEPETILNIRDLHSSESGFAVPDQCMASLDFHFPPDSDAERYSRGVKTFAEEFFASFPLSKHEIDFPTVADGYTISEDKTPAGVIRKVFDKLDIEWKPGSFKSHSDANLLAAKGIMPVILGPGQLSSAHTVDEAVLFSEVEKSSNIFLEILSAIRQA